MLKSDIRVAVGLALAAAAWCLVAAGWMMTAPMMAGGAVFYPALGLLVWCVIADIDRRRVEQL